MTRWISPALVLAQREVVRFFRQRSRVMGALLTPILFWVFLGFGFGSSFQSAGRAVGYQAYFFPGVILMVLMFTSIFSMVSLIEDRKEGFLQYVLVSSCPRASIVAGKVLGVCVIATFQALLVSLLGAFVGFATGPAVFAKLTLACALVSMNMALFGFLLAWKARSIQGFHVLMNLILMPMWLLSGAAFPVEGAERWITWIMRVNPLTYGHQTIQASFQADAALAPWFVIAACNALFLSLNLLLIREKRTTTL